MNTRNHEDLITAREAGEWSAWRLVNALAVREAIEVCSIVLRGTAKLMDNFQGPKPGRSTTIIEQAWKLLADADAMVEKEFAAWVASTVAQAPIATSGSDVAVLFRHATQAAALLFEKTVLADLQWQQTGVMSVWLGEPILRAITRIHEAIRAGSGIDPNADAAIYGVTEHGESVEEQIMKLLCRSIGTEERG